jgi:dTDP-4-amino-4,6-dideoxygalactose transaminase
VSQRIGLSAPDVGPAEVEAVLAVLRTPRLSGGPRLDAFERRFAAWVKAPHACGVSSGTAALHLCLAAAGVGEGDLVVTTPLSFVSPANAVLYVGGTPVFVDVDPATGNLDPARVEEAVRDLRAANRPVKAILPVHLFGQPADMDPLLGTARAHDLRVVEDACEAPGARYRDRPVGSIGDAAAFSFYPNKPLTCGEGGMAVTRHAGWADLFRSLRNQGRDGDATEPVHHRIGFNYRLDELSAALGLAQLERAEELATRRERVAGWYAARLGGLERVAPLPLAATTTRACRFGCVVRLDAALDRDAVMRALDAGGIETRAYFRPIHLQPAYRERFGPREGAFPVAERLGRTTLALPFSGTMTEAQVDRVCTALGEALGTGVR